MSARNQFVLKVFSQFLNDNRIVYKMIEDWLKSLKDLAYNLNNQSVKIYLYYFNRFFLDENFKKEKY